MLGSSLNKLLRWRTGGKKIDGTKPSTMVSSPEHGQKRMQKISRIIEGDQKN